MHNPDECRDHVGNLIEVGSKVVYARTIGRSASLRTGEVIEVLKTGEKSVGHYVPDANGDMKWVSNHHNEGVFRIKVRPDEPNYRWSREDPRDVYLRFPERIVVLDA